MAIKKVKKVKVNKKTHPKFNVPNFGAKNRKRVKDRWRKQRGQDNKKRIKKDFMGASPSIGYKNSPEVSGVRADGKRLMLVHNVQELSDALRNPEIGSYNIIISHDVGKKKRIEMEKLAASSGVRIANGVSK